MGYGVAKYVQAHKARSLFLLVLEGEPVDGMGVTSNKFDRRD